ncbi:hypothetical protein FRC10_004123 [Ceratobasidium sp. 414]|nr:hypothetical protein FRC10_004123 [Ceratobasidium sp. 414]
MVLLVDILATKNAEKQGLRAGSSVLAAEESYPMWEREQDVERCMEVLAHAESRWHVAGRLHDVLRELQRSGRLLTPEPAIPQQTVAGFGLVQPSALSHIPPSQPSVEPLAFAGAPMMNYPVTFNSDFASPEYSSSGMTRPAAVSPEIAHMSSGPSAYDPQAASYGHPLQFDHPEFGHPTTYPHNPPSYNQMDPSRIDSTNFVHPNPTDPYQYDAGAYLPDPFYGGDPNAPFPGIVPQLNFAPNHGRGELSGTGSEDPFYEGAHNPGWTTSAHEPTS